MRSKHSLLNSAKAAIQPLAKLLSVACLITTIATSCEGCGTSRRTAITMQEKPGVAYFSKSKSRKEVQKEKPNFKTGRKVLAALSEVSVYSAGKTEEKQYRMAEKEIGSAGLEFRKMLFERSAAEIADAYLHFISDITDFEKRMKADFKLSHNVDLVNQVIFFASARGRNPGELRLGCLLLVLHEIPSIRKSVPLKKDPNDDAIYKRLTLSSFLSAFMENDQRFNDIGNLVLMWADSSKRPHSKDELTRLFEEIQRDLQ